MPKARFPPIVFSNGSRDGGSFMSDIGAVGCLRSLRAHAALDGVSWVRSGLVEIAVGQTGRMLHNRRRHLLPPSGVAPLGSSVRAPIRLGWLCRFELGAVFEHRVHDDRQASRERDPRLAHRRSFGDRDGPVLELQWPLVARQHDVCGLVQEGAHSPITALRDAAGIVNLA